MENRMITLLQSRTTQTVLLSASLLSLAAGGAWLAYHQYAAARNRKAQLAFVEQLEQLEQARINPEATLEMWTMLEQGFHRGYQAHQSSSLAPYFLAFESEATFQAGNHEQAIKLLEEAVVGMKHVAPLSYLYAIKLGVMQLESSQQEVAEKGKRNLLASAQDSRNPYQGLAWYHLWLHAWMGRDAELVNLARTKIQSFPEWEQLIHEKLGPDLSRYEI